MKPLVVVSIVGGACTVLANYILVEVLYLGVRYDFFESVWHYSSQIFLHIMNYIIYFFCSGCALGAVCGQLALLVSSLIYIFVAKVYKDAWDGKSS